MKRKTKKGFTLAETLITIGIIGIVAALTLPTVMTKTQEHQTVLKVKRIYSLLQTIEMKMRSEHGEMNLWTDDSLDFFIQEFSKHVKIIKTCKDASKCTKSFSSTYPAIILADGTAIGFKRRSPNQSSDTNFHACYTSIRRTNNGYDIHYGSCAKIMVDINGKGKPNKNNYDTFEFRFYTNGVLPNGIKGCTVAAESFEECMNDLHLRPNMQGFEFDTGCTAWVVQKENMDYLHCPDKIGWDKASSCKEK